MAQSTHGPSTIFSIASVFDICFLDAPPEPREDGALDLRGEIILGGYREQFLAPVSLWSRERYLQQWDEAAARLLHGAERTAFFTVAWQFWWTMARDGESVLIQEELLTGDRLERLGSAPSVDVVPYELLEPIQLQSEDGQDISSWRVTISDVAAFTRRRMSSTRSAAHVRRG